MTDSVAQEAVCSDCGAQLPVGQNPPEPCPDCGGLHKTVRVALTSSIGFSTSVTTTARSNNSVEARVRELGEAIDKIEASTGNISDEQAATKRALEAIHELADCLKDGDWGQTGWSAGDLGLWRGLIGARNCAHHSNATIVAAHSGTGSGRRLCFDIDAAGIADMKRPAQEREYSAHVQGQPVVDTLRRILGLLPSS